MPIMIIIIPPITIIVINQRCSLKKGVGNACVSGGRQNLAVIFILYV